MKKIMVIMAVTAMSFVASAASITWTSGAFKLVDATGTVLGALPSGSINLVYLGNDASANWTTPLVVGTAGVINTGASKATDKGKVAGTYSFTYDPLLVTGAGSAGSWYGVVFNDGTTLNNLQDYLTDTPSKLTFQIPLTLASNTYSGAFTFVTGNFEAVPEPTAMALLALGVAVVGLRRKFTK